MTNAKEYYCVQKPSKLRTQVCTRNFFSVLVYLRELCSSSVFPILFTQFELYEKQSCQNARNAMYISLYLATL